MKYTFEYQGKNKTINIPDDYINTQKRTLGLSNKEAIYLFLCDEGYVESEYAKELTKKAKESGIDAGVSKKRRSPKRKEDPTKRALIAFLLDSLLDIPKEANVKVEIPEVVNPERVITFYVGDDKYELTLSKKRK